jgi:hypothetical protein
MLKHYKENFHIEQDLGWDDYMCPVTQTWSKTKRIALETWSLYERVGSPSYQTWRKVFKNEKEAQKYLDSLPD